jgi:hypothetical protein
MASSYFLAAKASFPSLKYETNITTFRARANNTSDHILHLTYKQNFYSRASNKADNTTQHSTTQHNITNLLAFSAGVSTAGGGEGVKLAISLSYKLCARCVVCGCWLSNLAAKVFLSCERHILGASLALL